MSSSLQPMYFWVYLHVIRCAVWEVTLSIWFSSSSSFCLFFYSRTLLCVSMFQQYWSNNNNYNASIEWNAVGVYLFNENEQKDITIYFWLKYAFFFKTLNVPSWLHCCHCSCSGGLAGRVKGKHWPKINHLNVSTLLPVCQRNQQYGGLWGSVCTK